MKQEKEIWIEREKCLRALSLHNQNQQLLCFVAFISTFLLQTFVREVGDE